MKASDINPKKNPAFSKRLYNWCKRKGGELQIYHKPKSDSPFYGSLYIGTCLFSDFTGARIARVCQGNREIFCWPDMALELEHRPDIEEAYLRIGRCALDPSHVVPFIDARWDNNGVTGVFRVCRWCGVRQALQIETKTVQTSRWVVVPRSEVG